MNPHKHQKWKRMFGNLVKDGTLTNEMMRLRLLRNIQFA